MRQETESVANLEGKQMLPNYQKHYYLIIHFMVILYSSRIFFCIFLRRNSCPMFVYKLEWLFGKYCTALNLNEINTPIKV